MRFNILAVVVTLFVQGTFGNPNPLLLSGIVDSIKTALSGGTTTTTVPTTSGDPTATMATAYNDIQTAIQMSYKLKSDGFNVLDATTAELSVKDKATYLSDTLGTAIQLLSTDTAIEKATAIKIIETLLNVIHNAFTNTAGTLNDKTDALTATICNVTETLEKSNLSPIIGKILTDITNYALKKSGTAVDSASDLTLIANALIELSQIAVLNDVVTYIQTETGEALAKIKVPTNVLTTLRNILDTLGAGITDLTTTIPVTPTVSETADSVISTLADGAAELGNVVDALTATIPGIELKVAKAFAQIAEILAKSTVGDGSLSDIASLFENVVNGIESAVKSAVKNVVSLVTGGSTSCSLSGLSTGSSGIISSFVECVTNETESLKAYKTQYETIGAKLQSEKTAGTISVSTLSAAVQASGDVAFALSRAAFRITNCATFQAVNTASVVLPLVKAAVACLA